MNASWASLDIPLNDPDLWEDDAAGFVQLRLVPHGTKVPTHIVVQSLDDAGSHAWTIPDTIPPGNYFLSVVTAYTKETRIEGTGILDLLTCTHDLLNLMIDCWFKFNAHDVKYNL